MYILLGILLALLGLAMMFCPGAMYGLLESWKHDGSSEPSRLYLLNMRLGGVIFTLVGIGGALILLFNR